jgi:hypothetical protein
MKIIEGEDQAEFLKKKFKNMSDHEVECHLLTIAEESVHKAIMHIQEELGAETGDQASYWFAPQDIWSISRFLASYASSEVRTALLDSVDYEGLHDYLQENLPSVTLEGCLKKGKV